MSDSRALPAIQAEVLPLPGRWSGLRSGNLPVLPIAILGILILTAIFADVLAPSDPEVGTLTDRFKPPAWIEGGSRAHPIGTTLGILSGYLGGWVDQVIMRLTDTWLALPALTFAIFLAAVVGPSVMNIVIILSAVYWTRYARVIRGEVLSLRERDFVRLAVVAGCSKWTIMRRHILPNVINSAIVLATLQLGQAIIAEATLSFLGVGVPPPLPAWGLMLADGKKGLMAGYWWLTVLPGLCIVLMVLSANLLGDWLRVKLDPQLRQL